MDSFARVQIVPDGDSQLVRLPRDFRLPGDEVEISRSGDGVTLKPVRHPLTRQQIDAIFAEIRELQQGVPEGDWQEPDDPLIEDNPRELFGP